MKQIRVELAKWVDGQGWQYNSDIDSYELPDNDMETVDTYISSPRFEMPQEIQDGEDYELRVYTNEVLTDSAWLSEKI